MIDDHVLSKPELRQSKPDRADFAVQARNPVTVVLDGVRGYYNIGAIFRLCDAFLVVKSLPIPTPFWSAPLGVDGLSSWN
jgi:hypothetical protein